MKNTSTESSDLIRNLNSSLTQDRSRTWGPWNFNAIAYEDIKSHLTLKPHTEWGSSQVLHFASTMRSLKNYGTDWTDKVTGLISLGNSMTSFMEVLQTNKNRSEATKSVTLGER